MNRASWALLAAVFGAAVACGPIAPPKQAAGPRAPDDESAASSGTGEASAGDDTSASSAEATAPKGEAAKGMKGKIDARIAPFRWGMSSSQAFAILDKQLDEAYAAKMEKVYSEKMQANLEIERDKRKEMIRKGKTDFTAGALSGYEVKTPGEFTYNNDESAIEAFRPGSGERILFFIGDKLWKIYDSIPVGEGSELGDGYASAITKLNTEFGEKGQSVEAKKPSASYYGTMITTPAREVWFDGTTQVRLVDNTGRRDSTVKNVALVYEDAATVQKLPTLRTNIEKKADDAEVDAAAADTGKKADPKDKKKKK